MKKDPYGQEYLIVEENGDVTMYLGHPSFKSSTRVNVNKAVKLGMCIARKEAGDFIVQEVMVK